MKNIINLSLVLFLLAGCSFLNINNTPVIEDTSDNEVIEENEDEPSSISLIMCGDAVIHESVYLDNETNDGYDFTYPLEDIKSLTKNYDLAYYNQETVLGGTEYGLSGYPVFNSPQEVGDAFIDAGFNLVSLSTNHLLDYYAAKGDVLIKSQREYFLKHKDVISSGSYLSDEDKNKIVIGEKNGITYALLSYTSFSNSAKPNEEQSYLCNFADKESIKKDVEAYRDKVDLLIVAMHWGEEYETEPNSFQKEYAKYLADLDVDIVVGTHPHVLQPIEWIDDTLVLYSLGNIISNQYFSIDALSGALVSLDITKNIEDGKTKLSFDNLSVDLTFTVLDDRHKVYFYKDLTDNELTNHNDYFNQYANLMKKYESNIEVR